MVNIAEIKRQMFKERLEKAFGSEEIEKARHGVYADNAENRAKQRVGQEYGQAAQPQEPGEKRQPKGGEEGGGDIKSYASNASDEALKRAAADKNAKPEVREAAKNELANRGNGGNDKKSEPAKKEEKKDADSPQSKDSEKKTASNTQTEESGNKEPFFLNDDYELNPKNPDAKRYGELMERSKTGKLTDAEGAEVKRIFETSRWQAMDEIEDRKLMKKADKAVRKVFSNSFYGNTKDMEKYLNSFKDSPFKSIRDEGERLNEAYNSLKSTGELDKLKPFNGIATYDQDIVDHVDHVVNFFPGRKPQAAFKSPEFGNTGEYVVALKDSDGTWYIGSTDDVNMDYVVTANTQKRAERKMKLLTAQLKQRYEDYDDNDD